MSTLRRIPRPDPVTGLYYPKRVPLAAIRRFADQIAERFHPHKIILFGSYAYGTPTPDSDVDLLVIMPTHDQLTQAVRIDEALERGFPLDLLVRTPRILEQRLRAGDWFLREIVSRGKVLYEKTDGGMGSQGRGRLRRRQKTPPRQAAPQ
jgi:uncharacterized protein